MLKFSGSGPGWACSLLISCLPLAATAAAHTDAASVAQTKTALRTVVTSKPQANRVEVGKRLTVKPAPKKIAGGDRANAPISPVASKPAQQHSPASKSAGSLVAKPIGQTGAVKHAYRPPRKFVVAIDAGHGGKDTGAIGPGGTREKDVVLAIARKLADMLRAEPDMQVVMVRQGDEFVELSERAAKSRRAHADLFVSLHADAYMNAEVKGSAVFTLSSHGATSVAARWLANRENAADLMGGVKLRDKDKVLAKVLLDLSQGATNEASDRAAGGILRELRKSQHLHHEQVQKAGFMVLKSPDVPSLLVETAFISNPEEENNLRSQRYQTQLARAIFYGVRGYFGGHRSAPSPQIKTSASDQPRWVAVRD